MRGPPNALCGSRSVPAYPQINRSAPQTPAALPPANRRLTSVKTTSKGNAASSPHAESPPCQPETEPKQSRRAGNRRSDSRRRRSGAPPILVLACLGPRGISAGAGPRQRPPVRAPPRRRLFSLRSGGDRGRHARERRATHSSREKQRAANLGAGGLGWAISEREGNERHCHARNQSVPARKSLSRSIQPAQAQRRERRQRGTKIRKGPSGLPAGLLLPLPPLNVAALRPGPEGRENATTWLLKRPRRLRGQQQQQPLCAQQHGERTWPQVSRISPPLSTLR